MGMERGRTDPPIVLFVGLFSAVLGNGLMGNILGSNRS